MKKYFVPHFLAMLRILSVARLMVTIRQDTEVYKTTVLFDRQLVKGTRTDRCQTVKSASKMLPWVQLPHCSVNPPKAR